MSVGSTISINGSSCRDWSMKDYTARIWQGLTESTLAWTKWGPHEPYRREFGPAEKEVFLTTIQRRFSDYFGYVGLSADKGKLRAGFDTTHGPKPHFSSMFLHCAAAKWPANALPLQTMTFRLFSTLECFHGRICHDGEFHGQHYSEKRQPKEGTTRVVMLGVDYRQGIPGVYWGNLFGPPVTEWIGVDRLGSCPCHKHVEFAPGYHMIVAYPDIESFDTPTAVAARDAIRKHLGLERFYDRRFPDRETVSPPLDLSELYRPPPEPDPAMEAKLKSKARKMGGWLEIQEGEMRLHLEGTPEPEENR